MNITIRNNEDGTFYLCIRDNVSVSCNVAIPWEEVIAILTSLNAPK